MTYSFLERTNWSTSGRSSQQAGRNVPFVVLATTSVLNFTFSQMFLDAFPRLALFNGN